MESNEDSIERAKEAQFTYIQLRSKKFGRTYEVI